MNVASELIKIAKLLVGRRITFPPAMKEPMWQWVVQTILASNWSDWEWNIKTDQEWLAQPENQNVFPKALTDRRNKQKQDRLEKIIAIANQYGVTRPAPFFKEKKKFKTNLKGWEFEKEIVLSPKYDTFKYSFKGITVELTKQPHKESKGSLDLAVLGTWNNFKKTITIYYSGAVAITSDIDDVENTLEHELVHAATDMTKMAGIELLDVGSGANYSGDFNIESHVLADSEFYTRLNDSIVAFRRRVMKDGNITEDELRNKMEIFIGNKDTPNTFFVFEILKRKDKKKWEKAKELFYEEFNIHA